MKTIKKKGKANPSWFWVSLAITLSATPAVSVSTVIGDRTIVHVDVLGMEGDIDLTLVDNLVEYVEEKLQSVKEMMG